jgi:hypothetical protein
LRKILKTTSGIFEIFLPKNLAKNWCGQKTLFSRYTAKIILQISEFPKKRDSNPLPHGDNAADIAKMLAKYFSLKSVFR